MRRSYREAATVTALQGDAIENIFDRVSRVAAAARSGVKSLKQAARGEPEADEPEAAQAPAFDVKPFILPGIMVALSLAIRLMRRKGKRGKK